MTDFQLCERMTEMNVYIYQADVWCEDCAEAIKSRLASEGNVPEDPSDETTFDSDEYPKGPYDDGGGEADSPQHCGAGSECLNAVEFADGHKVGCFLENPLTSDGVDYLVEQYREDHESDVVALWVDYYDDVLPKVECPTCLEPSVCLVEYEGEQMCPPCASHFQIEAEYDAAEYEEFLKSSEMKGAEDQESCCET